MNRLPLVARVYVTAVVTSGLVLLGVSAVFAQVDDPARFLLFLLLSCLASAIKVRVPVPRAQGRQVMTMSLSFMMNFAALLVIGVHEATLIAAAGAWSQSTFNVRSKNPLYRTLFNVAGVAISVAATGWMYLQRRHGGGVADGARGIDGARGGRGHALPDQLGTGGGRDCVLGEAVVHEGVD
jgi:hypothetical protein